MEIPNEKTLFAVYARELRESEGWKVLAKELERTVQALENRILNRPTEQADNTVKYTRTDLEREVRRILLTVLQLPETLTRNLEEFAEE